MAIKEIKFATDGTITLIPEAPGAEPIVVVPRIGVQPEAELTYDGGEALHTKCINALTPSPPQPEGGNFFCYC